MKRSEDRILTSHTGRLSLPGMPAMTFKLAELDLNPPQLSPDEIQSQVDEAVRLQVEAGIDIVNDGQLGSDGGGFFSIFSGVEPRHIAEPSERPMRIQDLDDFPGFYEGHGHPGESGLAFAVVEPLTLTDPGAVDREIARTKSALADNPGWEEAFFSVISPSWFPGFFTIDEHYDNLEEFLFALADVMKPIYESIVDAGLILSIDAPDLVWDWEWASYHDRSLTFDGYRKMKQPHIEATNYALEGIPEDRVRVHACWGSWPGPHVHAAPLGEVVELLLAINAQCISIESAKPNRLHEWKVWQDIDFPDGKILMPGVIDHCNDVCEHPQEIADRLIRFAGAVGRENVIAGTDCGMRRHPEGDWAKYRAMVEGARLASQHLWA